MSDPEFFQTRMGARFYEHTVPALVEQLALLNANIERLIELEFNKSGFDPAARRGDGTPYFPKNCPKKEG